MRWFATLWFATIVLWTPAFAQQAPSTPTLFQRLAGQWVLRGVIDGEQSVHDVDADLVLNGGYVRLHETSREKDPKGAPAYEAFVFVSVDRSSGVYNCLWLDNTSNAGLTGTGIAHGKPSGNSIPFIFFPGTAQTFHTTFVYEPANDTWKWLMDGEEHGVLHPFARVTLSRKGTAPSS